MRDIVIATRNTHKCRELAALLCVRGVRWRGLAEFPQARPVAERGRTFAENAVLKARAAARDTGCWALADDSGIEVEALGWAPGIRSARFAGRHGHDRANNDKMLRLLRGLAPAQRRARYCCVLALARPGKREKRAGARPSGPSRARSQWTSVACSVGRWVGRIAEHPQGRGGFGYDPIFWLPRLGMTAAQLSASAKNRLSHRAQAAARMRRRLRRLLTGRARTRTGTVARSAASG